PVEFRRVELLNLVAARYPRSREDDLPASARVDRARYPVDDEAVALTFVIVERPPVGRDRGRLDEPCGGADALGRTERVRRRRPARAEDCRTRGVGPREEELQLVRRDRRRVLEGARVDVPEQLRALATAAKARAFSLRDGEVGPFRRRGSVEDAVGEVERVA